MTTSTLSLLFYMIDHFVLMVYLKMAWIHKTTFAGSLVLMGKMIGLVKALGVPPTLLESNNWREIKAVWKRITRRLFLYELGIMFFENAMFVGLLLALQVVFPK